MQPVPTSFDPLRPRRHALDAFFAPKAVAVIGATETPNSVGRTTLWNLISSPFGGAVYPVNPKRPAVLGIPAYPSVRNIPAKIDLAVVVSPAPTVPGVLAECAAAGIKNAIVISAGFKEMGPQGEGLEREVITIARKAKMRLIGPNCLGVMNPISGLNATFARGMGRPGNVAFLSQSGALGTAVLDWSLREMVGFSAFISLGSMADVSWGDLIDYLGDDARTHSILIYMETVGDARAFLSAAREVALSKPIIIIKAGRTAAGGKAAASHTGSLTGSDDVLDAAFRRCGVLRVNNISDLFYMAEVLARQPRPKGPRLTILTNAGGPAVLATDALITAGGELAPLSPETVAELDKFLPPSWSRNNPIDILGDAGPERYAKSLEIAARDPNSDGLLVVLTPQAMTDPTLTAELLKPYAKLGDKPVLASWMGGPEVAAGEAILNRAEIPTFAYPDTAAKAFQYMWAYSENLRILYETPELDHAADALQGREEAAALIRKVRQDGRTLLTEHESKQVLRAYGIPTVETLLAPSADEAVSAAKAIGYPVVLKLHSRTITHKTDVGGVLLHLADEAAVRDGFARISASVREKAGPDAFEGVTVQPMIRLDGYELILGSSPDPQFGPTLLFGLGGQLVEVFKDRALGIPPLTTALARRMMERTKIYAALLGVRGRDPVDLPALERLLVRFSQLVVEQRMIREIDINPLLASPGQLLALDARVVLYGLDVSEDQLPRLPIRPYPSEYAGEWKTKNGLPLLLRPIRPEDEPLVVAFHQSLSERSVYQRYLQAMNLDRRTAHERMIRICFNDYDREIALVAEAPGPRIVGIARLAKERGGEEAEIAMIVSDAMQGQGLGGELTRRLIEIARKEKVHRLTAEILAENLAMQRICVKAGFRMKGEPGDPTIEAELPLE